MKLNEIKYSKLINPKVRENIVFAKDYPHVTSKNDYGILFGGISMIPYRCDVALRLYNDGLLGKIVLTGGIGSFNTDRSIPEALKMRKYLLNKGIPDSDMIIESNSRTTLENVKLFLSTLKKIENTTGKSMALITSDFHIRRCLLLVKSLIDSNTTLSASASLDGKTDINHWQTNYYGQMIILKEALSLLYYAKKGVLPLVEIEDIKEIKRFKSK